MTMKLATTTCDFDRYTEGYLPKIKEVSAAGFRYIDLSLYTVEPDDELMLSTDWETHLDAIAAYAADHGLTFVQCHSPDTNPLDPAQFDRAVAWNRRAIEICGRLGIPNMVVHSGWDPSATRDEWYTRNKHFFTALFDDMEKWNVNVLHENTTSANMPWFYPKTGAEMRAFSEYVNHPRFHSCWDTGHANVEQRVPSQDDNDQTKAVRYILDNHPEVDTIHILGATGKRECHTIGNLSLLMEYAGQFGMSGDPKEGEIFTDIVSDYSTAFAIADSCELWVGEGRNVSIFSPDNSLQIRSQGLVWPTDDVRFDNWWKATLNRASSDSITLTFSHRSAALVILD